MKIEPKHLVATVVAIGVIVAAIVLKEPNILWALFIVLFIANDE